MVASGTEWERAGITGATVTATIVRGLIERDAVGRLALTKEGRAVLDRWSGEAQQENAIGRADRPHDAVQVTAGTLVWSIKAKSLILWCARHNSNV